MPDIHVPKLDEHGSKSVFKLALEVAMIGIGVFLGLAGEQYRERAHQRELAEQALRRFKTEITANRSAIASVKDYHADRYRELQAYFNAKPKDRKDEGIHITKGMNPAFLEHSAWDLAIATQSLGYVDAELAVKFSSIYNLQQAYAGEGGAFLQGLFARPPTDDVQLFLGQMLTYCSDATIFEPKLLSLYDDALQRIDKALGNRPAVIPPSK